MIIKRPCCITSRLLPGIRIGDMCVSIEYDNSIKEPHRQYYRYYLDHKDFEYTNNDLSSHSPSLQNALGDLLSYLCDSSDSFPTDVEKWANRHSDELSLLASELEETPNIIDEGRSR